MALQHLMPGYTAHPPCQPVKLFSCQLWAQLPSHCPPHASSGYLWSPVLLIPFAPFSQSHSHSANRFSLHSPPLQSKWELLLNYFTEGYAWKSILLRLRSPHHHVPCLGAWEELYHFSISRSSQVWGIKPEHIYRAYKFQSALKLTVIWLKSSETCN